MKETDASVEDDSLSDLSNINHAPPLLPSEFTLCKEDRIADLNNVEDYIEHLALIVETSDDAIISKTLDGVIKSWNKGGERMFGYTALEAIGQNICMLIPEESLNEETEIISKIRNNETIDHYETVRMRKDGSKFNVSLTVSPIKNREGLIIGVSKIARDITARKQFEEQINVADIELAFQNNEKEKRAIELDEVSKSLTYQKQEKKSREEELETANNQLAFESEQKEIRAAELILANMELIFQNKEKEKRAAELIVANTELIFQNMEKEKRAQELVIANEELAFQNKEKEKRAAELVEANKELQLAHEQQQAYIEGLNELMFITSHKIRQPVASILQISSLLENFVNSVDEIKSMITMIEASARSLDSFTRELTTALHEQGAKTNDDC